MASCEWLHMAMQPLRLAFAHVRDCLKTSKFARPKREIRRMTRQQESKCPELCLRIDKHCVLPHQLSVVKAYFGAERMTFSARLTSTLRRRPN
mmetsp:Transcript_31132/g.95255  ORF Transcript_31132/g.95255 Transcript_31132/m.95255 type:complete len:93 (+) Transcript_31132:168-446(+)